jgi:heme/copper-type cytochrome/quinol oxidase subunit 1
MSNKEVIKEIVWCFLAFLASYCIAMATPALPTSFSFSDILFGTEHDPLDDAFSTFTLAKSLVFFFPLLFLLSFIRALAAKFSKRPLNIFLLFVSFVSLGFSFIFLQVYEFILPIGGGWTIYPPLSAIAEKTSSPLQNAINYSIYGFITLQLVTLIISGIKIFTNPADKDQPGS